MFTWICPKCGGEVPPSYDECPRCHPKQASTPAAVQAVEPEPVAVPHVAPVPVAAPPPPPPPAAPVYAPPVQAAPPPPPPSAYDRLPPAPPPPPLAVGETAYGGQAPVTGRTVSPVLAALGAAAGVAVLLALLYVFVLPHRGDSDGASAKDAKGGAVAETARLEKPGAEGASGRAHPLAKHIEVAGVRLQEQSGGKVRIDFVVVNHSAADLPQLKMDVRLASGGREYFVIPVDLPSIGPYESKDLSTSVKTNLKPYELPDWQLMQAKFSVHD